MHNHAMDFNDIQQFTSVGDMKYFGLQNHENYQKIVNIFYDIYFWMLLQQSEKYFFIEKY